MDEKHPAAVTIEVGDGHTPGAGWLMGDLGCTILLEAAAELAGSRALEIAAFGEPPAQVGRGDIHDGGTD